jgi:hypothetical protein
MAESKLPLTVRKELRDNEAGLTEALAKLKAATGAEWKLEADWLAIYNGLGDNSYKNQLGQYAYGSSGYFGYFATNLAELVKNPMSKESFEKAVTNKTVIMATGDTSSGNTETKIVNGQIKITIPGARFAWDCSSAGGNLESQLSSGKLPLTVAKELKDNNQSADALAKLKAATGVDWKFDVNWEDVYGALGDNSYKNQLGQYGWGSSGYLTYAATNIESAVKDDMVKEAILEAASTRTIKYVIGSTSSGSTETKFVGGVVVVTTPPERFAWDCSSAGSGLESQL